MARDCMSSSSTVRLTPAPSPTRAVARRTRRKFYYWLRLLLVPTTLVREIIILFGIYMSFSRFQYELLVHTVIYERDKFVQCYEASSFCFMYLASKVARCNISSNTKETNMHAIASQWLTYHSKYVLPPFQNKCLNFMQTLVQSCTTTKVDTYFGT